MTVGNRPINPIPAGNNNQRGAGALFDKIYEKNRTVSLTMHSPFWSNTIWYVLLGITSILSIGLSIYKSKNRGFTIVFTLATLASTYYIETVLLGLFNAYRYFPKLDEVPYIDAVIGNYFSQSSISTTAVLIAVMKLGYKWYFIFAALYYLIEELFLRLGIYRQNWYHSWFTFAGVIPFFWLVKRWYHMMLDSPKFFIYFITLFLATFSAYGHSIVFFLFHYNIKTYQLNFYPEQSRNLGIGATFDQSITVTLMVLLYCWKINWKWKGVIIACLFAAQYLLGKAGIIHIKDGWFLIVTALNFFGCYFWVAVMDYVLRKGVVSG